MDETAPDVQAICRLCLESTCSEFYHIFHEGLNNKLIILTGLDVCLHQLSELFKFLLMPFLQMQINDALPKKICRDCRYQLEKSHYFRMVAKQSDTRLRKHLRLVNQGKTSNVLSKEYADDDSDEYEEKFLESNVI